MEHYLGFQHAWLLLLLPPAWATCYWAARRQAAQGNSRLATFLLQALLITLLLLAVSGPSLRLSSAGSTTVLIVDTSGSMRGAQVSASDIIKSTRRRLARVPGARLGIVVLGRQARVALRPQLAEDAEAFADITLPQIPQDATDIAAGLSTALAMIPIAGQIILWSDGMETTGDAAAEARLAASHGVRIHVWRPAKAALPDAQ
ncbi:MAG: VWA domain-containing protein, partial [Phycisphaerae bacterium]|nr:VWA domain-containing protein [Phycisphaerae bacterium]